jgi:hypothetical protein
MWVGFFDEKKSFHNHSLIVNAGTKPIYGNYGDFEIDVSDVCLKLFFYNNRWYIQDESVYGMFVDTQTTVNQKVSPISRSDDFVAELYKYHYVDTREKSIVVYLPMQFEDGDWFVILDKYHTFDEHNLIVLRDSGCGTTLIRKTTDFVMNTQRAQLKFVYFEHNWDVIDVSLD